jgi:hypothetical protein
MNPALLVTASKLTVAQLCGDTIITEQIPPSFRPFLLVNEYGKRSWQFFIDEIPTWLSFTSRFISIMLSEYDDSTFEDVYEVYLGGQKINAQNWRNVHQKANTTFVRLILKLNEDQWYRNSRGRGYRHNSRPNTRDRSNSERLKSFGQEKIEEAVGSLNLQNSPKEGDPNSTNSKPIEKVVNPSPSSSMGNQHSENINLNQGEITTEAPESAYSFHYFTWLAEHSNASMTTSVNLASSESQDGSRMLDDLYEVHEYLTKEASSLVRSTYMNAKEAKIDMVNHVIPPNTSSARVRRGRKIETMDFRDAAKSLMELFVPLDIRSVVIFKYWGSLIAVLTVSISDHSYQSLTGKC